MFGSTKKDVCFYLLKEKQTCSPPFVTSTTPIYLDCNATTPLEDEVKATVLHYLVEEFGNAGSRTHEYGNRAKVAVQQARDHVAAVVSARREEVIFTSGATESNNLALLGLREYGAKSGRKHIVSTAIEHKAVLEPLDYLRAHGFDITLLPPESNGQVQSAAVRSAIRSDTLVVSVLHANNETGVLQPIDEIASALAEHDAFLHVDAAQSFGKELSPLKNPRIDLISLSGHKIYGPKGIGALITRRRGYDRPPLAPLMFGGGQERGLRPGTLPVALIAGLGKASELALRDHAKRRKRCLEIKEAARAALREAGAEEIGASAITLPSTLNARFAGLDSEALMVALKDLVAISNGSACTSSSYTPSHVLKAMGLDDAAANQCLRFSWSHLTPSVDWKAVAARIKGLQT